MFTKKQLVVISLILAIIFHFIFYFDLYGVEISVFSSLYKYILAIASSIVMIIIYFGTYWRADLKEDLVRWLFDLLMAYIFIFFVRGLVKMHSLSDLKPYLFSSYTGLVLFPVLFFIAGVNFRYFFSVNRILSIYFWAATVFSLFFINYFELQHFLLLFIFYTILTIPLRSNWGKYGIFIVSVIVVISSLTNRSEILRIGISYLILLAYYFLLNKRLSRKIIYLMVFILLLVPAVSLYLGTQGESVFQIMSSDDDVAYSQLDPYADTRTFLYFEVFQDLKINKAFLFGKGLDGSYYSPAFVTFDRLSVEVGFLQIILKTGIVGCILYLTVIIMSIRKALTNSNNLFIRAMGLLLASYIVMLFLENIIAFNLLNIVIWLIIGMCNSPVLRKMNDVEIKDLFKSGKYNFQSE